MSVVTLRNVSLLDDLIAAMPSLQGYGVTHVQVREGNQSVTVDLAPKGLSVLDVPEEADDPKAEPSAYDKAGAFMLSVGSKR